MEILQKTATNSMPSKRDFNLMIVGQIISILGSALLRFALSLYVLDITGRADIYATLYAVSNIPLLLAPVGGVIADRFNRRNLMVIFDFSSSFLVLCLLILMRAGFASIAVIGIIMVLMSVISSFYTPTVTASIPLLVPANKLEGANGAVQAVQALSAVAAPIIGGLLYGAMGIRSLVFMSSIAFFMSAVMEIFIRIPYKKPAHTGPVISGIAVDLKDGFKYVAGQPFIRKSIILAALINLLLTPYFLVGGPIVLRVTMGCSDKLYGLGMGLINAATILGALLMGVFSKKLRIHRLYRCFLLISLLLIPMAFALTPMILNIGFAPSYILFIGCGLPIAMLLTVISLFVITKVQKKTPNENLGKVMAIIMAVSQCAAPVGQFFYGLIFQQFSGKVYIPSFLLSGIMLILAAGGYLMLRNEQEDV